MTAGVAATTRTPAAQPKRTIADSPKTNANETPLASRSSHRNREAICEQRGDEERGEPGDNRCTVCFRCKRDRCDDNRG
jgi:hypothetical protein